MEPRPLHRLLTALSLSRVALAVMALVMFEDTARASAIVAALALLAQLTDHFDGFIARRYSIPSAAGDMVDSVSDKAMQFALTIAVCREFQFGYAIAWLAFMREISILSVRTLMRSERGIRGSPKWMARVYAGGWRIFLILLVTAPIAAIYGANFFIISSIAQSIYYIGFAVATYSFIIELKNM